MVFHFLLLSAFVTLTASQTCNIRKTDEGSVCVCNAKYCDSVPCLDVASGKYQVYSSSKDKLGFSAATESFSENSEAKKNLVKINQTVKYQTIIGFGGAFTDSVGINIKSLSEEAQRKLIESYFGESGISYSLCRVPIGGTDFSTRGYSYDDVEGDTTLEHFALQYDDFNYKIPYIQQANSLRNTPLKLFASAWSAPPWMKTNNDWASIGTLKEEYYQLWANFILKFYEEYKKRNITFWGMTTQNEPILAFKPKLLTNSMGWLPSQMKKWISENLGPTIRNSSYKDLKIMLHDDNRAALPLIRPLLDDEATMKYADGVAIHWYTDKYIPPDSLNLLKRKKDNWFFISSEACNGYYNVIGLDLPVRKGSWQRGENYITDILDNLEHGAGGWVDWNMVLDESGGPTYIDNFVDSPVIVNKTLQEFYKQPMFYAIGHFSKFVIPDSVRVESSLNTLHNVRTMAFLRPDNLIALIIYNRNDEKISLQLEENGGNTASITVEGRSINTVLYQK